MLLRVDHESSVSLHEQIAGSIRAAIASGELHAGEKLPPARQLAEGLDVNVHTLLRAMQTLRDEGLLEMRRGRGTAVTGAAPNLASFNDLAKKLVAEARRGGMNNDQILQIVKGQL